MDVLPTLAQIVAVFGVTILPFVLIVWFLAGRDPDPVSDVIVSPRTPWPHGVQEEEPRPWRFKQVPARSQGASPPMTRSARRPATLSTDLDPPIPQRVRRAVRLAVHDLAVPVADDA